MSLPAPIAHWPFNEGTGTTAADASGNGHTATLVNATWDTTLKKFGAAALKNLDVGVGATIASFNVGTVYSIGFWINGWDGTNDGLILGGALEFYGCYLESSYLYHSSGASNWARVLHGSGMTGSHHIVVVRNGLTITFYKDGASLGSASLNAFANIANTFTTLNGYVANTYPFVGTIDDLRIYDVALSGAQVTELFALTLTEAQLSQLPIEVAIRSDTPLTASLSQLPVEVASLPPPPSTMVSQLPIEVAILVPSLVAEKIGIWLGDGGGSAIWIE